jgi:hypothetical protein
MYNYANCVHIANGFDSRLLKGILFVSRSPYFNPVRISPSLVTNQGGRLQIKSSRATAVFITTGAVAKCQLIHAGTGGTTMAPYAVKNISLYPLPEDYERFVSFFGTALGQKVLYGAISGGSMTFSTRKEGATKGVCILFVSIYVSILLQYCRHSEGKRPLRYGRVNQFDFLVSIKLGM